VWRPRHSTSWERMSSLPLARCWRTARRVELRQDQDRRAQRGIAIQYEASQLVALRVGQGSRILMPAQRWRRPRFAPTHPRGSHRWALDCMPHRTLRLEESSEGPNIKIIKPRSSGVFLSVKVRSCTCRCALHGTGTLARHPESMAAACGNIGNCRRFQGWSCSKRHAAVAPGGLCVLHMLA